MIKSLETTARNYAKKSLMAFIQGGKYTKNRKPLSSNWMIGVIKSSGVKPEELKNIFSELQNCPQDKEEKSLLDLAFNECQKQELL